MGLAALAGRVELTNNASGVAADPAIHTRRDVVEALVSEISLLIGSGHDLDRIERTLTDGYAHALSLEGEQLRLERRIGEVARAEGDDGARARELASLTGRLDGASFHLARLRALLGDLRQRADQLRVPNAG